MNGTILKEIDARRARRAYDERPVGSDVVDRILAAATLAPSCSNKQPWRFVVVDREPGLGRVRESLQPGNYCTFLPSRITASTACWMMTGTTPSSIPDSP